MDVPEKSSWESSSCHAHRAECCWARADAQEAPCVLQDMSGPSLRQQTLVYKWKKDKSFGM